LGGIDFRFGYTGRELDSETGNYYYRSRYLTTELGVEPKISTTPDGTSRLKWEPNENTRIRFESHPEGLKSGDPGYNPRHHGEHYHIETKPSGVSWNQASKKGLITKSKPAGYTPGDGTGFLSGEKFPGL
jgi:hypothetical protein